MTVEKIHLDTGLDVYYAKTNKFKTIVMGLIFTTELTLDYLMEKSLLGPLLTKKTNKYPSEIAYARKLKEMYDTHIGMQVATRGQMLNTAFIINQIDKQYLTIKTDLFNESLAILKDIILDPVLKDSFFLPDAIASEKKLLIDELGAIYNNKAYYAKLQLIKAMFKDEVYHLSTLDDPNLVKKITRESLKVAYHDLLKQSCVGFVIGSSSKEEIIKSFSQMPFQTTRTKYAYLDLEEKTITKIKEIKEGQAINQSTLSLGYRTAIRVGDPLYPAMLIFNGMFGKYYHSRLYRLIREEHSLAYYLSSEYATRKGALFITLGIAKDNYDQVRSLIKSAHNEFKTGIIDLTAFELTKKAIINGYLASDDAQFGKFQDILMTMEQGEKKLKLADRIEKIKQVTIDEVIACSKMMTLDTVFFLAGMGTKGEPR